MVSIKALQLKKRFTHSVSILCAATAVSLMAFSPAHAQEEKILNIYNWSDYIADDTIKNFEKETGKIGRAHV